MLLVFLFIILMPITVMTVMAFSSYRESSRLEMEERKEEAYRYLLQNARLLQNQFNRIEEEMDTSLVDENTPAEELRTLINGKRLVKQAFLISPEGQFLFPEAEGETSERERDFIEEAESIDLAANLRAGYSISEDGMTESHWYTWFRGDGINFIFYTIDDGSIRGFLIERYALISRLINVLPDSSPGDNSFRVQLTDARGDVLYQWGSYTWDDRPAPFREYSLKEPLGSWRLFYYRNNAVGLNSTENLSAFSLLPALALFTLLILLLAAYFYRENTRQMRIARNQVTFVNQVSHEFKTPLTNIRLYSELLQNRISDPKDRKYLDIIIQEGSRLGRMINNVLTFSRGERGELKKRIVKFSLNDLIRDVLGKFTPLLEEHAMEYSFQAGQLPEIETDRDMVEQILVNIIGNAIKYGRSGRYLGIQTENRDKACIVFIRDKGPGIAEREKKNIFKPFYRIDNSLSQSSSGTGIGLSIARTLAEETGASLNLEDSDRGACFSLTIPVTPEKDNTP
jgi:signal transduction histidine kinase